MNKYKILGIFAIVVIVAGVAYAQFVRPKDKDVVLTGETKEFTVVSEKDQWNFVPNMIEVKRGDKVVLNVVNKDSYDHGIAIDAFGVSQRMPANGTIKIEFVAAQTGEFLYYCSVPCGEGQVAGHKRTHFDMVGKIKVI
jgi:heme/copper-type cytochrome/quinol oxidase subunit 2